MSQQQQIFQEINMPCDYAVIIHTNQAQLFGANIAFASFDNTDQKQYDVHIMNVEDTPVQRLFNKTIKRGGKNWRIDKKDLQSFTLSRFYAPKMFEHYKRILVIDPDIFYLGKGLNKLFQQAKPNKPIAAVYDEKKKNWLSSVMLINVAAFNQQHEAILL